MLCTAWGCMHPKKNGAEQLNGLAANVQRVPCAPEMMVARFPCTLHKMARQANAMPPVLQVDQLLPLNSFDNQSHLKSQDSSSSRRPMSRW